MAAAVTFPTQVKAWAVKVFDDLSTTSTNTNMEVLMFLLFFVLLSFDVFLFFLSFSKL